MRVRTVSKRGWLFWFMGASYMCYDPRVTAHVPSNFTIQADRLKPADLPAAWAQMLADGAQQETVDALYRLIQDIFLPAVMRVTLGRTVNGGVRIETEYGFHLVGPFKQFAYHRAIRAALKVFGQTLSPTE